MNTKALYIKVSVDEDAYIFVHDDTDYSEITLEEQKTGDYAFIELLMDKDDEIIDSRIEEIIAKEDKCARKPGVFIPYIFKEFYRSFEVPYDGKFTFMKMLIPTVNHYESRLGIFTFHKPVNFFVMDGEVYKFVGDLEKEYILENIPKIVITYPQLVEETIAETAEIEWAFATTVSIAHLNKCLLNAEKRVLEEFNAKGINFNCEKLSELQYKRDILLDAHRVLLWLLAKERYDEALVIINKIMACGGLCQDDKLALSGEKSCGCGKTR